MRDSTQIRVEDIEALAHKLERSPGLDDHDRDVLTAVFVLAGMSAPHRAEVSAFGSLACTCSWQPPTGGLKFSADCPVHASSAVSPLSAGFSFGLLTRDPIR